ncbi:MAG: DnaJ domain-containing protein [Verrucomicrobia bacterium]|nr:DnaJ domain-containing protein [Cytophagales bacterium]
MTNLYEILGVDKKADKPTIKAAYKKMALLYHPDRNPDNPAAEERFKLISEAYHILSDEEKKLIYDLQFKQVRQVPAYQVDSQIKFQRRNIEFYRERHQNRARYVTREDPDLNRRFIIAILITLGGLGLLVVIAHYSDKYFNRRKAEELYSQAKKHITTKEFDQALIDLNKAIYKNKNFGAAYYERGQIQLTVKNDYDYAESDFEMATLLIEKPEPIVWLKLGFARYKQEKYADAIVSFSKILNDPQTGKEALFFRAVCFNRTKQSQKACQDWLKAQEKGMNLATDSLKANCETEASLLP